MSTPVTRIPRLRPHPRRAAPAWLTSFPFLGALLFAGYYVGLLIANPQRRVIQTVAGLLLIYLATRFTIYQSLAFFIIVYPYPTFTSVGSTNTLILLVISIVWATRAAAGEIRVHFRSLLTPILPLVILGYLLSTYSIQTDEEFSGGMGILFAVLSCLCLYFMVVNFVRDETTLRRTLYFFGISAILIHTVAVYEVLFPGHAFLPGWLLSERAQFTTAKFGVRTGGPFRDFELLSEFCAVTTPIVAYMWVRSPRTGRGFWSVVLGMTIFSQFATVTRGGFISLGVGLIYLLWLLRREIGAVRAVSTLVLLVTLTAGLGLALPHVFRMESLFTRLERTKFEHGMPDSRVATWTMSWERIQEHPILGHGPLYTFGSGLNKYSWPHNGYLFLWVTIGITGLIGYIAIFLTCFFATGRYRGRFLSGPYVPGLLTAFHVSWLVFIVDQVKIDFERNPIYFQFTWLFIGLTAAAWQIARAEALQPAAAPAPEPEIVRLGPVTPALSPALPAATPARRLRKITDP